MSDAVGEDAAPGPDDTVIALDELLATLEKLRGDQEELADRVRALSASRRSGATWREAVEQEEPPGTLQLVSQTLAELSASSGRLRRALAVALRQEGTSIPSIAGMFGVTHQRVSNLLRRTR